MKKAVLFMSASTAQVKAFEQQAIMLAEFCTLEGIEVAATYIGAHNGKPFGRPGIKEMLTYLKHNSQRVDYLLLPSWDRFSLNSSEVAIMTRYLKAIGIEAKAVEEEITKRINQN